jgi:hypothetical protein
MHTAACIVQYICIIRCRIESAARTAPGGSSIRFSTLAKRRHPIRQTAARVAHRRTTVTKGEAVAHHAASNLNDVRAFFGLAAGNLCTYPIHRTGGPLSTPSTRRPRSVRGDGYWARFPRASRSARSLSALRADMRA